MAKGKPKRAAKRTTRQAANKAGKAVTQLRKAVGLPASPLAREISAKIKELARDKNVLVQWDIRVIPLSGTVEAVCNCTCYA
jgi:hypothetical protein